MPTATLVGQEIQKPGCVFSFDILTPQSSTSVLWSHGNFPIESPVLYGVTAIRSGSFALSRVDRPIEMWAVVANDRRARCATWHARAPFKVSRPPGSAATAGARVMEMAKC